MDEKQWRASEITQLLGISYQRLYYAVRKGQVPHQPRSHPYARLWYTTEEVRGIAKWFGAEVLLLENQ